MPPFFQVKHRETAIEKKEGLNSWSENTIYRLCFHLRVMTEPGVILMYQAQFSLDG